MMKRLLVGSKKKITLVQIAEHAGVSVTTVSRALNDDPRVSAPLKERIHSLVTKLDYQKIGRSKEKNFRNLIGLTVPNVQNPYFSLLIKGIENVARIQGYHIILTDSEDDVEVENSNVQRLNDIGVEGLIVIPVKGDTHRVKEVLANDFPIVFLDRTINTDRICSVTVDNVEGAYQATKYLIGLGHRDICYVSGSHDISTEKERYNGFVKAMTEASITIPPDTIVDGDYDFERSFNAVSELIKKGKRFTGMFATSDIMAFGALKAFKEFGMSVPDDVSLVGYDDILFSAIVSLTTVSQPKYELGRNAIILLFDLIKKKVEPPQRIVLNPSMVIRATARRLP